MNAPLVLLVTSLLGGAADDLVKARIGAIEIATPVAWKHRVEDGTHVYEAPSEDASFKISVYPVDGRDPAVCLAELQKALGGDPWQRISVGTMPAVKKVSHDSDPEKKNEVQTNSYVGCDGRTKWALTFTMTKKKRARFEPLAEKIARSVVYPKDEKPRPSPAVAPPATKE